MRMHHTRIHKLIAAKLASKPFEFTAMSHHNVLAQQFGVRKLLTTIRAHHWFSVCAMASLVHSHFRLLGKSFMAIGTLKRSFIGVPTTMMRSQHGGGHETGLADVAGERSLFAERMSFHVSLECLLAGELDLADGTRPAIVDRLKVESVGCGRFELTIAFRADLGHFTGVVPVRVAGPVVLFQGVWTVADARACGTVERHSIVERRNGSAVLLWEAFAEHRVSAGRSWAGRFAGVQSQCVSVLETTSTAFAVEGQQFEVDKVPVSDQILFEVERCGTLIANQVLLAMAHSVASKRFGSLEGFITISHLALEQRTPAVFVDSTSMFPEILELAEGLFAIHADMNH